MTNGDVILGAMLLVAFYVLWKVGERENKRPEEVGRDNEKGEVKES